MAISSCLILQFPLVGFFTKDFTFAHAEISIYLFAIGCVVGTVLARHCWWKEQKGDKGYKTPRLIGLGGGIISVILLFIFYHSV